MARDHNSDVLPSPSLAVTDEPVVIDVAKPHAAYRPDVDGLRTLAVLPVVVFHAYPELFPGGFIGVDIFFVISGYLISGILFKENQRGSFTYTSFYTRRVRRIFPTLILVLSATLWMGYLYLMAAKLKALAATMLAGTLFCANLQVLSLEHSYFALDIKMNPLLHLWSLGVEEQFYIFWPLLASLVMRLPYKRALYLQVAVLLGSFLFNILFLGYHDNNNVSFYNPLSRFWQMAMGGLLAYTTKFNPNEAYSSVTMSPHSAKSSSSPPSHARRSHLLSVSGLVCILFGFYYINEARLFPGFWALLPTVGATLLIAAGPDAIVNTHLLSNRVAVYIGKISYCLYLWHWPLLVFAKERYPDDPPLYASPFMMLLASFLLSVLTYKDVETPLRHKKAWYVTPMLVLAVMALAVAALCVYTNPSQFSAIEIEVAKSMTDADTVDLAPTAAPVSNQPLVHATEAPVVVTEATNNAAWTSVHATNAPIVASVNVSQDATARVVATAAPIVATAAPIVATAAPIVATAAPVQKKRPPTTLSMVRKSQVDGAWNTDAGITCPADLPYVAEATTPKPFPFKEFISTAYPEVCQLLNPHHEENGVLVVLGDSHADMTKPRIVRLFEEATAASRPFPTVVFKTRFGRALLSCRPEFSANMAMLKKLKPQAVLLVIHWIQYLNPAAPAGAPQSYPPKCCWENGVPCKDQSMADVDALLLDLQDELIALRDLGIKVFLVDQSPEYDRMNPATWLHGESVKLPTEPVLKSVFQHERQWLFDRLHRVVANSDATLIDYADNYSEGDKIKFVDDAGVPYVWIYNHLTSTAARNHLHVVDQVVAAALTRH
ncbi:hypothetical protein SPRG_11473 [Saprolegnia parasitica CBS 223.65]|uniref:Acyltransferase 3 domain-containing protein n=1 Tax=Saprolegnia parasitica (strain CBS 223.65) TaxID=695850 RepID=A0A067CA12_SAPPC|nr:hypothetical protein SPRG_11473 [Saprolegnia parasitica CBS 223.65]KDO23381.1 hypothetical protein SPRG_11473 [Saprolegnia parasitica CBS 223.65]|eukprot:XP_012205871.1 hypothetical protein SPRG_11473 [Saprolegnia parasitica CBS 223.65]